MAGKSPVWATELRNQLKREHGFGWTVRERHGKVQVTRRWEDGSRSAVVLPIPWNAMCGRAVLNAVAELRHRMETHNLSLGEAQKLLQGVAQDEEVLQGALNWQAVAEAFLASKADRRATTKRDLAHRVNLALTTLNSHPRPKGGPELMRRYAAQHFSNCPPGGTGRKRHLGDVAAFLRFAVEKQGAPYRWRPLDRDSINELIGTADRGGNEITPPLKPEHLANLLDALEADGRTDLWLAVGLVGLYGLRPAELAALQVDDGKLYVGSHVKRNIRTMRQSPKHRLVLPLDIPGREGEGQRMLELFHSGLVKLPRALQSAINSRHYKKVGEAFRQLLIRYRPWRTLMEANPGLTPYSMRHGYAWRAHKCYPRPVSVRDISALMGHTPATHHQHYGQWVDEAGLLQAVENATGFRPPAMKQPAAGS